MSATVSPWMYSIAMYFMPAVLGDVVQVDDRRVVQLGGQPRLVEEHRHHPRVLRVAWLQQLEHDRLLESAHRLLLGDEQLRHPARGEVADHRVAADLLPTKLSGLFRLGGRLVCGFAIRLGILTPVLVRPRPCGRPRPRRIADEPLISGIARPVRLDIPRDVSLDGHVVDGVLGYLTLCTGIAFALLVARARGRPAVSSRARRPPPRALHHGDRLRDRLLTFAVGLTLFVAIDVTLAVRASGQPARTFLELPRRAIRTRCASRSPPRQWAWTFRTAGPDGRFATP